MRPASHATRQPTVPAPITAIAIAEAAARASHTPLIAVSRFAASTARSGGTAAGRTCTAAAGTT